MSDFVLAEIGTARYLAPVPRLVLCLVSGDLAWSPLFGRFEIGQTALDLRTSLLQDSAKGEAIDDMKGTAMKLEKLTASRCYHLAIVMGELHNRYAELTGRIAALDKDRGRCLDSEKELLLDERRRELEIERESIVDRMEDIERKLAA